MPEGRLNPPSFLRCKEPSSAAKIFLFRNDFYTEIYVRNAKTEMNLVFSVSSFQKLKGAQPFLWRVKANMQLKNGSDRRLSNRFNVAVPFRYRGLNSKGPEQMAEAINISMGGLYFETDVVFMVDTDLQLRLAMPESVTGKLPEELHCVGHIVRLQPGIYYPDRVGVGVCLDSFDTLKNAIEAGAIRHSTIQLTAPNP